MIVFGCDHGGVDLKNLLLEHARGKGLDVYDHGTYSKDSVDYPDYARAVCRSVATGDADQGVLVCTSGIGMSISANKLPGVRAALVQDLDGARSSREHNDANVLVLSGAKTDPALARQIIEIWLSTPFGGGRHQRRVDKIAQIEKDLGLRVASQDERK
jgi:ribose 5-phosphate isomerase B